MIPATEPDIKRNDTVPSIIDQAADAGWEAGLYDFGKADGPGFTYFNPGLVRRPDGLWLLVRRSENVPGSPFGRNAIWAVKLDPTGRNPDRGVRLKWLDEQEGQQFEDARAFYVPHLNQVGVSACTFKWHGQNSWTGAIQVLGFFDENWQCKIVHYPPFDTNATSLRNVPREHYQKNWLFWNRGEQLHLIYKSNPWTVCEFGGSWRKQTIHNNEGATWNYGDIRGGTPPVMVDGKYHTFFHSSMPWRGNYRRYHMGLLTFSAEPPFEVLEITKEPLLSGSQNDPWAQRKPPCIFPCGAVYENGKWLVTAGVNDLRAAWIEIPHESLLPLLSVPGYPVKHRVISPAVAAEIRRQVSADQPLSFPSADKPLHPLKPAIGVVVADDTDPFPVRKKNRGKPAKPKRTPEQQAAIDARMAKARAGRKKVAVTAPV